MQEKLEEEFGHRFQYFVATIVFLICLPPAMILIFLLWPISTGFDWAEKEIEEALDKRKRNVP